MSLLKFGTLLTLILSASNALAFEATCSHEGAGYDGGGTTFGGKNREHVGVYSNYPLTCKIAGEKNKDLHFKTTLQTYGALVHAYTESYYTISCPLVKARRLRNRIEKNGSWSVAGPLVSLGIPVGVDLAVLANERGAVCFLGAGDIYGISVMAGVSRLTFSSDVSEK